MNDIDIWRLYEFYDNPRFEVVKLQINKTFNHGKLFEEVLMFLNRVLSHIEEDREHSPTP